MLVEWYTSQKISVPTEEPQLGVPSAVRSDYTHQRQSKRRGSNGATLGEPITTSPKAGWAGLRSTFHSLGTTTLGTRSASERSLLQPLVADGL